MIGSTILENAYLLTNREESNFLDGNTDTFYRKLNEAYGERVIDILKAKVDHNATMQDAYTDLISTDGLSAGDNGFNGEYAFPSDLLKPVRVEVKFSDTARLTKCRIYDIGENIDSEFDEDSINAKYSQNNPLVDFNRNSFRIRPLKTTAGNITGGIYIMYEKRQTDFTSTTEPTDIESNLQNILAYDLATQELIYHADQYSNKKVAMFNAERQRTEDRFLEFYRNRLPIRKVFTIQEEDYS